MNRSNFLPWHWPAKLIHYKRFSQDLELIDGELPTSLLGAGASMLIQQRKFLVPG